MPVDNYLVFYIPDRDAAIVTVIRKIFCANLVIYFNRKNLERELQNESRQHNGQQGGTKSLTQQEAQYYYL